VTMLHILSAGAAKGLVLAMQERFSAARGATFHSTFGAVGAMKEKLFAGEPCDLIILTAAIIDALAAQGMVDAASIAALGSVHTGIAGPSGQRKPVVADREGLRAALSGARGIYLPDPERATAGIHFANVLRTLGIFDLVRDRLRPFPNGATAMRAMSDAGESDLIGCTQVTEINYTEGVSLVGVLPREFELVTVYSLAVCVSAAEPALARDFAVLLTGPESLALRVQGGFVIE
jgi:molybdate transport system substrate-binding protein